MIRAILPCIHNAIPNANKRKHPNALQSAISRHCYCSIYHDALYRYSSLTQSLLNVFESTCYVNEDMNNFRIGIIERYVYIINTVTCSS